MTRSRPPPTTLMTLPAKPTLASPLAPLAVGMARHLPSEITMKAQTMNETMTEEEGIERQMFLSTENDLLGTAADPTA